MHNIYRYTACLPTDNAVIRVVDHNWPLTCMCALSVY